MPYSAYIPCFNNAATLAQAIQGVLSQASPPDELFVVDDASTDNSVSVAESMGVRVVRHAVNQGRGAVRARAMTEARHDLVLGCDAVNQLEAGFCEKALRWFDRSDLAGVCGIMIQGPSPYAAVRWRGRHLFKYADTTQPLHNAPLATGGAFLRASLVRKIGNFNSGLRHSEDADLGQRLIAAGYDLVRDPALRIFALEHNTPSKVLERYWRWNAGADEQIGVQGYIKLMAYAIKVMAAKDLAARDYRALLITLMCPHYQFWKSRLRSLKSH